MGQTASLPLDRREVAIGSPNIKPPAGWSNDEKEQFQPISPVSDVSNPSQFRHRLKPGEVVAPQTIYVSSTRRTSKVVGKTPARKRHSGKVLHPPDRFYFPEEHPLTSQHGENRPSHHTARSTRWKIYKRRLAAKYHEAKKQVEAMGNWCNPEQVMDHVQDQQMLGASTPVYKKNVKKVHQQVLNDSLSESGDEVDPVFGLSVNETYFGPTNRHAKITAFNDFPAVRQHNIDKSMEPYLQFHEPATVSPPERNYSDDASQSLNSIRRNNTDDSVLLEKSNSGTSSSDGSLESDKVLHARSKMDSVAHLRAVYREKENQAAMNSNAHETKVSNSHAITGSSFYSYDADSSSMQDMSRRGRKSEVSDTTQLTQSTLLADPSALLKMHLQGVEDTVNSPVAALFGRGEGDDYRPRVSSGLYSDMNSLVDSHVSVQERLSTGLFSDSGTEIEQQDSTNLYTDARTSAETQRSERTLLTADTSEKTAARVSDCTASSANDNQPKKSLDSQGSRRTVIHAVNLPLKPHIFVTGKKNSLDSQKTANTAITAEPLPPTGVIPKKDSRISSGSAKVMGPSEASNFLRASVSSDNERPTRSESIVAREGQFNALATTKEARKCHSLSISDAHDRTLPKKSEGLIQATKNCATSQMPASEQTRLRPSIKSSRRSSTIGRESLQLPALLQIAGWKNTGLSHAKENQQAELKDPSMDVKVSRSLEANDEDYEANTETQVIKRQSDPLPLTQTKGATAADMLRQSYPFFAQLRETETLNHGLSTKIASAPCASLRCTENFAQPSPCLSVESIPMLSSQVLGNAALLFSPSYLDGTELVRPQTTRTQPTDAGAVSINTMGSRGRTLSVVSRDPIAIPGPMPHVDSDVASKQSEKRVRFSDIMTIDHGQQGQPLSVEFPPIRHKLSDLSDTTGLEPYRPSISSIRESIAPIPEEPTSHANPDQGAQTRWTYARDAELRNGVTPLRSGRAATHATTSPLLRFQEARTIFSGGGVSSDAVHGQTGGGRVKGSIVSARIAEMEEKSFKTQPSQLLPSKPETTAKDSDDYLFEEEDETKKMNKPVGSIWRQRPDQVGDGTERSPTLINGNFVGSHDKSEATRQSNIRTTGKQAGYRSFEVLSECGGTIDNTLNPLADNYSVVSSGGESLRDLFKTHKANIEASNDDESLSDDDIDDFENMLNYQQDVSEESSVDDVTVSTIRQDRSKRFGSQYASYRMSVGGASVASSATGDTVSTIKQSRFSVASTNSSIVMKWEQPSLPFRKNAPVKPAEQAVHSAPGFLSVSPLPKAPVHARKWRDLAAAAQERNSNKKGGGSNHFIRSNLGERSVNVPR